jgi:AcrR family transcriptional regulator
MKNMREKILDVATLLFDARGINASGVDTIIAESGIAKATLYKHFPSKNQLVMAYLRDKSDRFYEWLNDKLPGERNNPRDILYELCELVEQWITTPEFHGLPFHIAAVEFPDPSHPINSYSVELSKELQHYLSRIAALASVKDPDTLGQQLAIIFEGAALIERLSPGSGAARRARNAALTLIQSAR